MCVVRVLGWNTISLISMSCTITVNLSPAKIVFLICALWVGSTSYMYILRFDSKFIAMHLYTDVRRGTLRTRFLCRRYTIVPLTSTRASRHCPTNSISVDFHSISFVQYNLSVLYVKTRKYHPATRVGFLEFGMF